MLKIIDKLRLYLKMFSNVLLYSFLPDMKKLTGFIAACFGIIWTRLCYLNNIIFGKIIEDSCSLRLALPYITTLYKFVKYLV